MSAYRRIAKRMPGVPYIYRALRKLRLKSTEDVFTDIYMKNGWGGQVSVSGRGSDGDQTLIITSKLPILLRDISISTMLDIPCGDFHWMKEIDLKGVQYIGADIVKELIHINRKKYETVSVRFQSMDLLRDKLPTVDLVLCRDCLVHFSFKDIYLALRAICNSRSKYLLTTTFTDHKKNCDIVTGSWRALNLQADPFMLPEPLSIINEGCSQRQGIFGDKSLALWRIEDIRESLTFERHRFANRRLFGSVLNHKAD